MSTYVLMRILESAPRRYELGIRLLTLGSVERAYERLAAHIEPGQRITQQTTHPIADLPDRLAGTGLQVVSVRTSPLRDFMEIVARRPIGEGR